MKFAKIKLAVLMGLFALTIFSSCSDNETNTNDFTNNKDVEVRSEIQSEDNSLFRNNYLVPFEAAQTIAQKIDKALPTGSDGRSDDRTIESSDKITDKEGNVYIYVFNYADDGYVMISADERHEPIISLVSKGRYQSEDVPSGLYNWLVVTLEGIDALKNGTLDNSFQSKTEWIKLITDLDDPQFDPILPIGSDCCEDCPNWPDCQYDPIGCGDIIPCDDGGNPCGSYTTITKGPLLSTEWGQSCGYNNLLDFDECDGDILDCPDNCNDNPYGGCVATGMAQILKYWAHPSSQGYNYGAMPNLSGNIDVQELMVDVGCSVDMDYGCDGSGASQNKVPGAFKDDFDYATAEIDDWNSSSLSQVKSDINQNEPVMLVGYNKMKKHKFIITWWTSYSEGHAWDCDGYKRTYNNCYSTTKLHMNWGWSGSHNGWYNYNTWNPGSYNFQYAREFIHNIRP